MCSKFGNLFLLGILETFVFLFDVLGLVLLLFVVVVVFVIVLDFGDEFNDIKFKQTSLQQLFILKRILHYLQKTP